MKDTRKPIVVGDYYESGEGKQSFLRDVFDDTAKYYEGIAKWGWFGSGDWYRREALKRHGLTSEMRALDVATGTGQVARALMALLDSPDQIQCVEPSGGMIAESKKTVPCVHHQSTAELLPVDDASIDFLTMGFALRHVDNLEETFKEFHRVLDKGGKVLIMDVTAPQRGIGRFFFKAYFKHILPSAAGLLTWDRNAFRLMRYYWDSMDQMVDVEAILENLRAGGFDVAEHKSLLGCFSEYSAQK